MFTVKQSVKQIAIKYGALYNWYAVNDPRLICSDGWHVPTKAEFIILINYLGSSSGGKMKEVGFTYWDSPNTGADNSSGFTLYGNGQRETTSVYNYIKTLATLWTRTSMSSTYAWCFTAISSSASSGMTGGENSLGLGIRPIKDSTTLSDKGIGSYTDPSGIIYPTICIGNQEWVASNIATVHYRNGDSIPIVTDTWDALTTGVVGAYDNNWGNIRSDSSPKAFSVTNKAPKVFTVLNILICGIIDNEMKYLQTVSLTGGAITDITTTLTSEPYNVFVLDSDGNELGDPEISVSLALVGGVYHVYIYTAVAIANVKVKILY